MESGNIEYDSYMVPSSDLEDGNLRLLEVDNRVILPVNTHVRVIVTSTDVIHSLAVPSLGVKIDCIPGEGRNWFMLGLVEAEGCFDIRVTRGKYVGLRFRMTLHSRDRDLLESVKDFFNCGNIGGKDKRDCYEYTVTDFDSINNKIRPYFDKYQLRGTKYLDYLGAPRRTLRKQ